MSAPRRRTIRAKPTGNNAALRISRGEAPSRTARTKRALLRQRTVSKFPLQPSHVVPLPELATHRSENTDWLEASATMECNACLVRERNAGQGLAVSDALQLPDKLGIE